MTQGQEILNIVVLHFALELLPGNFCVSSTMPGFSLVSYPNRKTKSVASSTHSCVHGQLHCQGVLRKKGPFFLNYCADPFAVPSALLLVTPTARGESKLDRAPVSRCRQYFSYKDSRKVMDQRSMLAKLMRMVLGRSIALIQSHWQAETYS